MSWGRQTCLGRSIAEGIGGRRRGRGRGREREEEGRRELVIYEDTEGGSLRWAGRI